MTGTVSYGIGSSDSCFFSYQRSNHNGIFDTMTLTNQCSVNLSKRCILIKCKVIFQVSVKKYCYLFIEHTYLDYINPSCLRTIDRGAFITRIDKSYKLTIKNIIFHKYLHNMQAHCKLYSSL